MIRTYLLSLSPAELVAFSSSNILGDQGYELASSLCLYRAWIKTKDYRLVDSKPTATSSSRVRGGLGFGYQILPELGVSLLQL